MKRLALIIAVLFLSWGAGWTQEVKHSVPLIGASAPAFVGESTNGTINFPEDFGKNWKILFSHPKDFTPVCSTEMLELAYQQAEYEKLGAKIIVVSTDRLSSHIDWKKNLEVIAFKERHPVTINFPLVEDYKYQISTRYGMIHPESSIDQNIRGVFFIDPENKVRAIYYYPNEVGRNMEEVKRTLIALQRNYHDKRVLLPANWSPGEDVMVPYLTEEEKAMLNMPGSSLYQVSWFMTFRK